MPSGTQRNKKTRTLDTITAQVRKNRARQLRSVFRRYVCLALMLHTATAALTGLYLFVWWDSGYTIVLFARGFVIVRILMLLAVLTIRIDVLSIFGVGHYYKILRHFKRYTPLGLWLLIGFVDLYFIRWKIVAFDVIHFLFSGPVNSLQFPAYLALDLLYIGDFYVTLHWVYYVSVRRNVTKNLLNATQVTSV